MPVTSATVQTDFLAYLKAGLPNTVRLPVPLTVKNDFKVTQDATDFNAQSAALYEARSPTAFLKADVKQRGDGRCYVALEFAADTPEEFHALFKQVADGVANVATRADSQNWRDNAVPTLTAFAAPVDTVASGATVEITLAEMKAQGDEADSDGTVDAFVVQAISGGALSIGATLATATAYAAGSNDKIDATNNAYYTVAAGAPGAVNAFTVKALDNDGWLSATAVQVQVTRT